MSNTITAEKRTLTGRATDSLRENGQVPAVLYGFDTDPVNITVDRNGLNKLYESSGESVVVEVKIGDTPHPALIQDVQYDPLTGFIVHADFRRLNMDKQVETTIPVKLIGDPPAVREHGGTLVQSVNEVAVKALPSALVRQFELDVTPLETFEDTLHVSDLDVPDGVEILTSEERSVATVSPPRTEEELEALEEAVVEDVGEVEITTEKVEEGEEGAAEGEGAEGAEGEAAEGEGKEKEEKGGEE